MPFKSDAQRKFLWATKPEVAKKFAEHHDDGGIAGMDRKPSKVIKKDRYGNQITLEYAPEIKPIDPTALAKHAMDQDMEVPQISIDEGHPGEPMGSDTVPAWLTPGEFVVNAEAMRIPGAKEQVEAINNQGRAMQQMQGGSIPSAGYNQGGQIPFIAGPRMNMPQYQDDGGWITEDLLDSLRFIESSDNNKAVSPAGAVGAYQWLPSSAKQAGYGVKAFDPLDEKAARAATAKYLKNMQKHHGFTPEETLQAYNWGPGNVLKYKSGKRKDIPKEAQQYAGKIFKHLKAKQPPEALPTARPEGLGIPEVMPTPRPTQEEMPWWKQALNQYVLGDKTQFLQAGGYPNTEADTIPSSNVVPALTDVPKGHMMFGGNQNIAGDVVPQGPEKFEPSFWDKYVLGPKTKSEHALTEDDKEFLDQKTAENEMLAAEQLAEEENNIANENKFIEDVETDIIGDSKTKENIGQGPQVDDIQTKDFKNDIKDEVAKKLDNETKDPNATGPGKDQAGENKSDEEVVKAGESNPDLVKKAGGWLKGAFGDLFDGKELARMAVMYAGGRALGYSHQGSLRHAAKGYITRIDAKSASRDAFIKSNAKNYTPASLQAYKESGDLSQLQKIGTPATRTGQFKTFYGKGGAKKAEQFKVGDNTLWSADGGKTFLDGTKYNEDPAYIKGTKENSTMVNNFISKTSDQLKSLRSQFDKYGTGDEIAYNTDINPATSAGKIADWAVKNGVRPEELSGLVESAYHDAINDKRQDGSRARSLVPYLNQLVIRQKVGNPDLFLAKGYDVEDKGAKQYVNAQKLQTLNRSLAHVMKSKGKQGGTKDLANLFYNAALRDWNKLSTKEQEKFIGRATDDESGFYKFVEQQALKYAS